MHQQTLNWSYQLVMSDLQKAFAKSKLGGYPVNPPVPFNEVEEEEEEIEALGDLPVDDDSSSASSASSASSTGTIIPSSNQNLFARPQGFVHSMYYSITGLTNYLMFRSPNRRTLDQIPWTAYFERELFLESTKDAGTITYHAYLTSPVGTGPLFVTHHGAGSSGLSFAVVASEIRKKLPSAGILSLDARGHGSTKITPVPEKLDLSLERLSEDLVSVIDNTKTQMDWKEMPPLVLIGHSLGGAVVTDVAKSGRLGNAVLGYAVLDVVEGSAIDALQSMHTYLSTRPPGFTSLQSGIEWHVRSRTIRNSVSARTSVPSLLTHNAESKGPGAWTWRTNLAATQPFWEGWFVGLSNKFLSARGGKLLLLAGTDRLDKELTIGQMQGELLRKLYAGIIMEPVNIL